MNGHLRWMIVLAILLGSFLLILRFADFAAAGGRVESLDTTRSRQAGNSVGAAQGADGAGGDAMRDALVAQEQAGMDALKTGDVAGFGSMVSEDAVFVDDHGPATKAGVVKNVGGFRLIDDSMEDVRLVRVSDTAGLIVYKLTERGTSHGREFAATVYVSTLYAQRGGKWVSLFSQETAARAVAAVKPAAGS